MELYHLRTFVAVAELQSVTHAAERLFATPPSVSAHIKALEAELNVVLFERTPRGMVLTPAGELLRRRAERALHAAEEVISEAAALQERLHGEVSVGVNATPSLLKLPQLINAVRQSEPRLRLKLLASSTGHIVKQLGNRSLDAGFLFGPIGRDDLAAVHLDNVTLVVAAPSVWVRQLRSERWDDIAALPWIASTVDCPFEAISDSIFARHGRTPPKVVMTDDGATKVDLIRAGTGAALMERSEAEEAAAQGGVVVWAPEGLRCPLHFAWPSQRDGDPALRAVRASIGRLWSTSRES